MTDTHAHLYDAAFDADRDAVLERARAAGLHRIYLPNCNSSTIGPMLAVSDAHPDFCIPMMGLHPCYVKEDFEKELALVEDWLARRGFAAVGEIGLDYYWDTTFVESQKTAFRRQMALAKKHRLPIVIHSRESTPDCIALAAEAQDGNLRGVFHCFSGTAAEAGAVVAMGFMLGIGGVVTYKKAEELHSIVRTIPLENLVLETDAPYLAPVPYRGKRNECAYTALVAERIAGLRGISVQEVTEQTDRNAERLFGAV